MIEQKKYTFKTPLVPTSGIEPLSTVLQTAAMTTSAKLALSWCSYQESNLGYILTKDAVCHLPIRANWYLVTGLNRRPSPCKGATLPLS